MVAYMLSLLVRNGEVQTAAVRWLAAEVSQALKADIDVGHVDYRFFNTLHIDDIYVSDQQGDTLAYVGTVDVQVRMRDLLRRKVSVRKVAIDRPYVNLHDHNYDFLVRALQSNDTTSLDSLPVAIEVNDVHITNIRARMDTLLLTDAEARMSLNRLDNDALEADIQTLHGKIVDYRTAGRGKRARTLFELCAMEASLVANDTLLGTVTGGGTFDQGATIEISATPNAGARFMSWDDGNTDNPRSVIVTQNMTFMAVFTEIPVFTITVRPESQLLGSTYGSGTYMLNQVVTIGATPNNGFYFSGWQDGNSDNPRTIVVTGNAEYIASFSQNPVQTYTVDVLYDESQGFILGAGTYTEGSIATIAAIPADGFYFKRWDDGTTDNPKQVLVDHDIVLAAFFEFTSVDENGFESFCLYPNPANDKIHIEGLEGEHEVQIYNAFGILVMKTDIDSNDEINIEKLTSGLYFIRISGHALRFIKE